MKNNPNSYENQLENRLEQHKKKVNTSQGFIQSLCGEFKKNNFIEPFNYEKFNVKRGLRNADGTGVMAGVTRIGNVEGYIIRDGEKIAQPGRLFYRGIDVNELIEGFLSENRFGYEETIYLLLFGALPTAQQLDDFKEILSEWSPLPNAFTEDMIIKAPSRDVMNKLARSTLALYSYESDPDDTSLDSELLHAIKLIARCPTIVAHAFAVKQHYYDNQSLYLHRPQPNLSIAENFLYSVRHDNQYTAEEARLLDLCLVLHAEHGGGNNSAFACRVVSSSGTDFYSAIAAAVGSLKGPRHGGANNKVMAMMHELEKNVSDWKDDGEVHAYLQKIANREAGDGSGLIYGMGHAIYTISDPRAVILKTQARRLAQEKNMLDELNLFESVERLAPEILTQIRGEDKITSANVDFYSGLIYKMMGIPPELYTPLFAIARMAGWCSHRIEEVFNSNKIIRPAYKALSPQHPFIPLAERT